MRAGLGAGDAMRALAAGAAGRCPACRAPMFRGAITLHERCPRCGLQYETESGAWLGATALGYAAGALAGTALLIVELRWALLDAAGLPATWSIAAVGVLAAALAYRPAKGLWFALLWLYELTGEPREGAS